MRVTATVVNVGRGRDFDVYIGRATRRARDPRCHADALFCNPFPTSKTRTREEAIDLFEVLMRMRLGLPVGPTVLEGQAHAVMKGDVAMGPGFWREELRKLAGKRLGCWCHPKTCHGDVLVRLLGEVVTGSRRDPGHVPVYALWVNDGGPDQAGGWMVDVSDSNDDSHPAVFYDRVTAERWCTQEREGGIDCVVVEVRA